MKMSCHRTRQGVLIAIMKKAKAEKVFPTIPRVQIISFWLWDELQTFKEDLKTAKLMKKLTFVTRESEVVL